MRAPRSGGSRAGQPPDGEAHREQHTTRDDNQSKIETREGQSAATVDGGPQDSMVRRVSELLLNAAGGLAIALLRG